MLAVRLMWIWEAEPRCAAQERLPPYSTRQPPPHWRPLQGSTGSLDKANKNGHMRTLKGALGKRGPGPAEVAVGRVDEARPLGGRHPRLHPRHHLLQRRRRLRGLDGLSNRRLAWPFGTAGLSRRRLRALQHVPLEFWLWTMHWHLLGLWGRRVLWLWGRRRSWLLLFLTQTAGNISHDMLKSEVAPELERRLG